MVTEIQEYNINYVNINSASREKKLIYESENQILLDNNPLQMKLLGGHYIMRINHLRHNFCVGDRITLSGVYNRIVILRTRSDITSPFQFVRGSEYLKIIYPCISDFENICFDQTFGSLLYVRISGFVGSNGCPCIGNIPVTSLNKRHRVYLTIPGILFDPNVIYIRLVRTFYDVNPIYIFPVPYNVTIYFDYIVGVPIGLINTRSEIHPAGSIFHLISSADKDCYTVCLGVGGGGRAFGGNQVYVSRIKSLHGGFLDAGSYSIDLDKIYSNVVYVGLVSSEFFNSEQMVRCGSDKNNAFYWENLEDAEHVYKVEIPAGNYSLIELGVVLENVIGSVPRIGGCAGPSYVSKNVVRFEINPGTNRSVVRSFKIAHLQNPIVGTVPSISDFPNLDPVPITIQINHVGHGLVVGDCINVCGAVAHLGIPDCAINGNHIVTHINNCDSYSIVVVNFNYLPGRLYTGGGKGFTVSVPNYFRIRMDFEDSICSILGFRDIGKCKSITYFSTIIKNTDPYDNDDIICDWQPKPFKLFQNDYFLMTCKQLESVDSTDTISNIFAKILISEPPGTVMYNTFVSTPKYFTVPLTNLYRLDISFLAPNGKMYNFNNMDHSFTLKIVTLSTKPLGTNLRS